VSQVLTRSLLLTLNYEATLEDGYLQSPYRSARLSGLAVPEVYPRARDGYALALGAVQGVGTSDGRLRGSVRLRYRYYWDTWDVRAHTFELGYAARVGERWLIEPHYRRYRQSAASFYADEFTQQMTFMARDRDLSDFSNDTVSIRAGYQLFAQRYSFSSVTLSVDYKSIRYDYRNFTDVRTGQLFGYRANVLQLFVSGRF